MKGSKEYFLEMQDEMVNTISQYENGSVNVLDCLIELKKSKKIAENIFEMVKDFESKYLDEITYNADQYPNGYKGYKIEVRNGRKFYNFSNIDEYNKAKEALKDIEEKYKMAFQMKLKGTLMANEDGEELDIPEMSISKSSIVLKEI